MQNQVGNSDYQSFLTVQNQVGILKKWLAKTAWRPKLFDIPLNFAACFLMPENDWTSYQAA